MGKAGRRFIDLDPESPECINADVIPGPGGEGTITDWLNTAIEGGSGGPGSGDSPVLPILFTNPNTYVLDKDGAVFMIWGGNLYLKYKNGDTSGALKFNTSPL